MVNERSWKEFRECGMLWFANMILHAFGWAICVEVSGDQKEVTRCYPARVRYRGFSEKCNTDGYIRVAKYIKESASEILEEAEE